MHRRFAAVAVAALLPFAALADAEVGKPAPEFHAKDINGVEQSLAKYKGSVVVLEWSNPGCPFVHKHYDSGNMQKLQGYAASKKVVWLTVNSSAPGKQGNMTPEEAKSTLAEKKSAPTAYILDPEGTIGLMYAAKTTPHMYVVDAKGTLAYAGAIDDKPGVSQDEIPGARNYVKEAVDALLAGRSVAVASTKAYGCSVKYKG